MNAFCERSILGSIEFHELFGEFEIARKLKKAYDENKRNKNPKKEVVKRDRVFEGTLVAVGWDQLEKINQSSLYTQDEEDILLDHKSGISKFEPFLNQKVQIWGKISTDSRGERRISVYKVTRLPDGFTKPAVKKIDEFGTLIFPAA